MSRRSLLLVPLIALAIALPSCTVTRTQEAPGQALPADTTAPLSAKRGVAGVVQRVLPATVAVISDMAQGQGTGTGFVVRSDGVIVTNYHVVEGAQRITVYTSADKPQRFDARVIGGDQEADLAVLKVNAGNLPTVPLGNSDGLLLGQQVVAIGYALGLGSDPQSGGGPSVTSGVVSSLDRVISAQDPNCQTCRHGQRTYQNVVQTDAAINPGNSGGPLVDLAGRVVGINTAGVGASAAENIGFAIQINTAKPTILSAVEHPASAVAYLGVGTVDASNPQAQFQFNLAVDKGAVVVAVSPGGPADRAGIAVADTVVSFDGSPVDSSDHLRSLIQSHSPGDQVQVGLVREGGGKDSVTVTLGTNPLPTQ